MNELHCSNVRELLSALVDEAAAPKEEQAAVAHLERCADCRAWLAQVRAAQQRLRAYPRIEPAPGFDDAVMARVPGRESRAIMDRAPSEPDRASVLTRLADALDRLICTPARQVAAAMVAALALSALVLFAALHVVTVEAPRQARGVAMLPEADLAGPPASMVPRVRPLLPEEIQRRLEEMTRRQEW